MGDAIKILAGNRFLSKRANVVKWEVSFSPMDSFEANQGVPAIAKFPIFFHLKLNELREDKCHEPRDINACRI